MSGICKISFLRRRAAPGSRPKSLVVRMTALSFIFLFFRAAPVFSSHDPVGEIISSEKSLPLYAGLSGEDSLPQSGVSSRTPAEQADRVGFRRDAAVDQQHALLPQAIAPFGTFSHDTALTLLGLTDIIPSTIHFTIPETARLRPRQGVTLHRSRHRGKYR